MRWGGYGGDCYLLVFIWAALGVFSQRRRESASSAVNPESAAAPPEPRREE